MLLQSPQAGNMSVLLPALKRAKEKNLKIAMHLSEVNQH